MSTKISSITQLINHLRDSSKDEYKFIGAKLEIPKEEFFPYAHWSKDNYYRNCIVRDENFELLLLCWEPGQGTPVHCHGREECWVYIIDGEIEESHFEFKNDDLNFTYKDDLFPGDKSFMCDEFGYHKLENNNSHRAMSLHLYMDPIDECTIFDEEFKKFIPVSLKYDTYAGISEYSVV